MIDGSQYGGSTFILVDHIAQEGYYLCPTDRIGGNMSQESVNEFPAMKAAAVKSELPKAYISNCVIQTREGDTLFSFDEKGSCAPTFDGYAVVPIEKWDALIAECKAKHSTLQLVLAWLCGCGFGAAVVTFWSLAR